MELQATKEEEIEVFKIGNRPPIFAAILSFSLVKNRPPIEKNRPPIWYFLGTRSVEIGHRFWSTVADFDLLINIKRRFQMKGSRILRPKGIFWSRDLEIWWETIKTKSQSSFTCMNPFSYVS